MAPVLPWSCAVTSAKFDSEFPEQLAADGMSDAAFRTHAEGVHEILLRWHRLAGPQLAGVDAREYPRRDLPVRRQLRAVVDLRRFHNRQGN